MAGRTWKRHGCMHVCTHRALCYVISIQKGPFPSISPWATVIGVPVAIGLNCEEIGCRAERLAGWLAGSLEKVVYLYIDR